MAIEDISRQLSRCQILRDKIREAENDIDFHEQNLASLQEKWRELANDKLRSSDPKDKETITFYLQENIQQQHDEKRRLVIKVRNREELLNDYNFNECANLNVRF